VSTDPTHRSMAGRDLPAGRAVSVLSRPWSWTGDHPRVVDALLAGVAVLPLGAFGALSDWNGSVSRGVLSAVLLVVQGLPLFWRRHYPLVTLAVVIVAVALRGGLGLDIASSLYALMIAVYSVSVYAPRRARLVVGGLAALSVLLDAGAFLIVAGAPDFYYPLRTRDLYFPLVCGAIALVAWVVGDYVRNRRRYLVELESRARVLEQEAERTRRQASEEERLRIARELHDVVAHNVSVIAIQAAAVRVAGRSQGGAEQALASIERTARDTLAELNRLLGVLRRGPGQAARSPQPGMANVAVLLDRAREGGLDVDLQVVGDRTDLPAALDLSAYRILQEAVTNVLKHASATRVMVRIEYRPKELELMVTDNGTGSSPAVLEGSTGHGLIGMRERTQLFQGALEVGNGGSGGFTVRARLPLE
jgi:signal transduction histidine kinase